MDQEDGAIVGELSPEIAMSGPYGIEEDDPAGSQDIEAAENASAQNYGASGAADSTALPGDEDSIQELGLESEGEEGAEITLSPDALLDLAAGNTSIAEGAASGQQTGEQAEDARELSQGL